MITLCPNYLYLFNLKYPLILHNKNVKILNLLRLIHFSIWCIPVTITHPSRCKIFPSFQKAPSCHFPVFSPMILPSDSFPAQMYHHFDIYYHGLALPPLTLQINGIYDMCSFLCKSFAVFSSVSNKPFLCIGV